MLRLQTPPTPLLGAHVSTAGGLWRAFPRAQALGCAAMQIFVKSPGQWRARPLTPKDVHDFRAARAAADLGPVVAHAAYLVNLAAADPVLRARSRDALARELRRSARLGVDALVVHPGAHAGQGEEAGLALAADSLRRVCAATPDCKTRLLLENTAGQGSSLGHRLEHLEILRRGLRRRVGVCLDTCHAFAAGYPIHEPAGWEEFMAEVTERFGRGGLACLHLNDSLRPFASRRDRHAHIGEGEIGRDTFAHLLADQRLAGLPMIVETDPEENQAGHRRDLATLRGLLVAD